MSKWAGRPEWSHLIATLIATALFAVTAWFANATFSASSTAAAQRTFSKLHISISSTLTGLSILQAATHACTTFTVDQTLEVLAWSLTSADGLRLLSFLSLSPATGFMGSLGLVYRKVPRPEDRLCAFLKLLLALAIWITGLVLFVNTSVETVDYPVRLYNATAGVGQFNGSFVTPVMQSVNGSVPYQVLSYVYDFVTNPKFSIVAPPINCTGADCESYLFPGGLEVASPWPPTEHPSDPIAKIYDAPACQIEFLYGLDGQDYFLPSDCSVYGSDAFGFGIELCVAESRRSKGSITAGLFICSGGTQNGTCLTGSGTVPNMTTTFSIYSRHADTICARSNNSIIGVSNLGPAKKNINIDMPSYRVALSWLLNFTASDIPPGSSMVYDFWLAQDQLSNRYWASETYTTFQSLLAFPLWEFSDNNFGNPQLKASSPDVQRQGLPIEFYTQASIVREYFKIVVNLGAFVTYVVLESLVLCFAWVVIFWRLLAGRAVPEISSFSLADFAFKLVEKDAEDNLVEERLTSLADADDGATLRILADVEVIPRNHGGVI